MKQAAAKLASKGVFIGTSSWKYEGRFGRLYTPRQKNFSVKRWKKTPRKKTEFQTARFARFHSAADNS